MNARRLVRRPTLMVRRVVAPSALEMADELPELRRQLRELREEGDRLRARVDEAGERNAELVRQIEELRGDLHESRRLNLRVAELTDLVTELVLPLHQREIDPAVLAKLDPDTL